MAFEFLGRVDALTPANLTIREQTRLALNPNELRWRAIFPKVDAPSIRIRELSRVDRRLPGGRREWNAQGREVPAFLGNLVDAEMVPINPTHHLNERELQLLKERAGGFAQLIEKGVVNDVDAWARALANAADIQIEVDAFEAWFQNQITVMDPVTGTTTTVSLGISNSRYVAASTTLAAATNAYDDFLGYLRDANSMINGGVGGVRLRQARLNEILVDAPAFSGDRMSLAGLRQRLSDEGQGDVAIIVDERTYDAPTDGGSAYTPTNYVPADRMAFQPKSGRVGSTHFAPVTRAYDYMSPEQVKSVNDFTVFYSPKNDGKTLMVEAQANGLTLADEASVYVVTGIA